jgi:hypothetical protein
MQSIPNEKYWKEVLTIIIKHLDPLNKTTPEMVGSKSREKSLINIRRVYYYLIRQLYNMPYQHIAESYYYATGMVNVIPNHATIIYHCKTYSGMLDVYPNERKKFEQIMKEVRYINTAPESFLHIINQEIDRLLKLKEQLLTNIEDKDGQVKLEQAVN